MTAKRPRPEARRADAEARRPGPVAEVRSVVGDRRGPVAEVRTVVGDRYGLSDVGAVVVATAAWAGAAVGLPVVAPHPAQWSGVGAVVVALMRRSPIGVVIAVMVLAAARAAALPHPATVIPEGPVQAVAEVRADPQPIGAGGGVRLDADIASVRHEVVAWGPAAARLRHRLSGERVALTGRVRPVEAGSWATRRGVEAVLVVDEVGWHRSAGGVTGLANRFRRLVERGAQSLHGDDRALFTGIVYGDDRNLSDLAVADFRAAGLTHLVAVSGQNVAFVLLVAGPILRRVGPRTRWALVLVVLVGFGTVTRFEPSVVRATAMAAVAATATVLGRESSATRTLALAVAAAIVAAPNLVDSVGFRLSVAATAGILWLSPRLSAALPGPAVVREALAVTAAAQVAVAPLLVATFGSMPVAGLPANLAAGPVAAPLMVWGLTGGVLAGVIGEPVAGWLHRPTGWGTGWLRAVAEAATGAPLGSLGAVEVFGGAVVVAALVIGRRPRLAAAAAIVVLALPALAVVAPPSGRYEAADGVTVWRRDAVVVEMNGDAWVTGALEGLRAAAVVDIDVIVVTDGASAAIEVAHAVATRRRVGAIWGPPQFSSGASVSVGGIEIRRPADHPERLAVGWASAGDTPPVPGSSR